MPIDRLLQGEEECLAETIIGIVQEPGAPGQCVALLAVLKGRGNAFGEGPALFLSPNGHLIISGADGTLRVYR